MNTPEEFLTKTESAVRKLFGGVHEYMAIIRLADTPAFTGAFSTEQERDKAFEAWRVENDQTIHVSLAAQREFLNESFALGALCGSILQVAATGIRWFSKKN